MDNEVIDRILAEYEDKASRLYLYGTRFTELELTNEQWMCVAAMAVEKLEQAKKDAEQEREMHELFAQARR